MTQLSLIQTSRNRKEELLRFVNSLNSSIDIDLSLIQLVFVDQGDNKACFETLDSHINFVYIQTNPCSLSIARNIGLRYAQGLYIGFPDDDCWYEPETLSKIYNLISNGYDGVIGYGTDENDKPTNVFAENSQIISLYNHCGAISYTIFLRNQEHLFFDENLGVGSPFGFSSGEETDFLIRFMNMGYPNVFYSKDIKVHHPSAKSDYFDNETKKMYYYARGYGYLMRKHRYPAPLILKAIIRPLGGCMIYFFLTKYKKSNRSWNILKGRVEGFFQSKKFL